MPNPLILAYPNLHVVSALVYICILSSCTWSIVLVYLKKEYRADSILTAPLVQFTALHCVSRLVYIFHGFDDSFLTSWCTPFVLTLPYVTLFAPLAWMLFVWTSWNNVAYMRPEEYCVLLPGYDIVEDSFYGFLGIFGVNILALFSVIQCLDGLQGFHLAKYGLSLFGTFFVSFCYSLVGMLYAQGLTPEMKIRIAVVASSFGGFEDGVAFYVAGSFVPVFMLVLASINMFAFCFSSTFFENYLQIQGLYYAMEILPLLLLCIARNPRWIPQVYAPFSTPAA